MNGIDLVRLLKPAAFKYNEQVPAKELNNNKVYFGFMAQDLDKILSHTEFALVQKNGEYFTVDYTQLIAPMVKAIQELDAQVSELQAKVNKLENDNE